MSERQYRIGHLTLQPHRQLMANEIPIPLGRKALELLSVLAEAEGGLVTKDELMAAVWPNVTIEENAVQVHIAALRKALGHEADQLKTVRSLGYRLVHEGVSGPHWTDPVKAVAVLPFANLTGDPGLGSLCEGVAEELINLLSHVPDLHVAARTSSFAYNGHDGDARAIAHALGVNAIVEGSVRKAGDTIRFTAQLVDGETGFHRWSENYDRKLGDLLALEDELGAVMALALVAYLGHGHEPER
jgi:TolB-like protein